MLIDFPPLPARQPGRPRDWRGRGEPQHEHRQRLDHPERNRRQLRRAGRLVRVWNSANYYVESSFVKFNYGRRLVERLRNGAIVIRGNPAKSNEIAWNPMKSSMESSWSPDLENLLALTGLQHHRKTVWAPVAKWFKKMKEALSQIVKQSLTRIYALSRPIGTAISLCEFVLFSASFWIALNCFGLLWIAFPPEAISCHPYANHCSRGD